MRGEALVMAGPGDEMAAGAGGRSRLRTSDADRERVVELLKAAFVQGQLAKDEFDLRVGQALASRTYAELDAVTASIPKRAAALQPPRTPLGAYVASRQRKSAIGQYERALADQERTHERDHPDTITARAALAAALRTAGIPGAQAATQSPGDARWQDRADRWLLACSPGSCWHTRSVTASGAEQSRRRRVQTAAGVEARTNGPG
jgi:hypothetical protein